MKFLIENFSFLIGDMVPPTSKAWKVYLELRKMCFMITDICFTKESLISLKKQISLHHRLYKEYLKKQLKPKHHFLLHYVEMITQLGPPRDLSCLRCEGKHKPLKDIARVTNSRLNPPKTLAIKHQLQLNYRFLSSEGFGKRVKLGNIIFHNVKLLPEINFYRENLNNEIINNYVSVSWCSIYGTYYERDSIIWTDFEYSKNFGKIEHILFSTDTEKIVFLCQILKTIKYSKHFSAYIAENTSHRIVVYYKDLKNVMLKYNMHNLQNKM